jgi:hypothetical protein
VEVKWSDRIVNNVAELDALVEFAQNNVLSYLPLVTTKTITDQFLIKGVMIRFQPIAEYVYTVGKNLLENKVTENKVQNLID